MAERSVGNRSLFENIAGGPEGESVRSVVELDHLAGDERTAVEAVHVTVFRPRDVFGAGCDLGVPLGPVNRKLRHGRVRNRLFRGANDVLEKHAGHVRAGIAVGKLDEFVLRIEVRADKIEGHVIAATIFDEVSQPVRFRRRRTAD